MGAPGQTSPVGTKQLPDVLYPLIHLLPHQLMVRVSATQAFGSRHQLLAANPSPRGNRAKSQTKL